MIEMKPGVEKRIVEEISNEEKMKMTLAADDKKQTANVRVREKKIYADEDKLNKMKPGVEKRIVEEISNEEKMKMMLAADDKKQTVRQLVGVIGSGKSFLKVFIVNDELTKEKSHSF